MISRRFNENDATERTCAACRISHRMSSAFYRSQFAVKFPVLISAKIAIVHTENRRKNQDRIKLVPRSYQNQQDRIKIVSKSYQNRNQDRTKLVSKSFQNRIKVVSKS